MYKKNYIKKIIYSIWRRDILRLMCGYRVLKGYGDKRQIGSIKRAISLAPLNLGECISPLIYGKLNLKRAELSTRQYLLYRLAGIGLNKAILRAAGKRGSKIVYPMPKEWREVLNSRGYEVANILTPLLWWLYVIATNCYGILRCLKMVLMVNIIPKNKSEKIKQYAYFYDLTKKNIPYENVNNSNIITWYLNWRGHDIEVNEIRHGVVGVKNITINKIGIVYQSSPYYKLEGIQALIGFIVWLASTTSYLFLDILRGNWWHCLMFNEAVDRLIVERSNSEYLAKEYFFHNSNWIYRPLWTYEAENRGSKIFFYFYSTNIEDFIWRGKVAPIHYGFQTMSWSNYLVWDIRQAKFIEEAVGDGISVSVVGEIDFLNSDSECIVLPAKSIAVFDVQPKRETRYRVLGADVDYYRSDVACKFIRDIYSEAYNKGITVAFKSKRNMGGVEHPVYKTYISRLESQPHFLSLNYDADIKKIISNSIAVLSAPFTSTAILGKNFGKPSAYYDPTGLLQKNDPATHGITILSGKAELAEWINLVSKING